MFRKDLIFLHAPSVFDFRKKPIMFGPVSDVVPSSSVFEMYPVGITSIAEYLEQRGFNVQIINLAYQMLRDKNYNPEEVIKALNPRVFAIDLHWLPHAHGSIEVAKIIKKYHPTTPVIFGGLSASYYHEELIDYPFVDFVVRGDSTEEPVHQLMKALSCNIPLREVPNLTWKENGEVKINPLSHVPKDMDYTGIPSYNYVIKSVFKYGNLHNAIPYLEWLSYPTTALLTSRGCVYNCAICGGSSFAYKKICNRTKPAFRSPKTLLKDIRTITSFGKAPIFILNDIRQAGREYVKELFQLLKEEQVSNELVFELFGPAEESFFKKLSEAVPKFSLEMTLESQDETIRRFNGKFACSNEAIERTIAAALKYNVRKIDIFFMTGIPKQSYESAVGSIDYCRELLVKFGGDKRLVFFIAPLAPFLDPGSLAFELPDKYGYKKFCHTLEDHYNALSQPSWKYILNYETDAMTRDDIVKATYEAARLLNNLKYEFDLIDEKLYTYLDYQIYSAKEVMEEIDEIMNISDEKLKHIALEELKLKVEMLNHDTICGKDELKWPLRKRFASLLSLLKLGSNLLVGEICRRTYFLGLNIQHSMSEINKNFNK